jgi:hypothetical protein
MKMQDIFGAIGVETATPQASNSAATMPSLHAPRHRCLCERHNRKGVHSHGKPRSRQRTPPTTKRERGIDYEAVKPSLNCDLVQKFPVRRVGTGSDV